MRFEPQSSQRAQMAEFSCKRYEPQSSQEHKGTIFLYTIWTTEYLIELLNHRAHKEHRGTIPLYDMNHRGHKEHKE